MNEAAEKLRGRAAECSEANSNMTQAARLLERAMQHAEDGRLPPNVKDAIFRAQREISAAQGKTEARRRRFLRKADAKEKDSEHC